MKIKLISIDGYSIAPERAHYNDSGADCFAARSVVIPPRSVMKVPTGVGAELPDGYDIVVHCKSSLSSQGIWAANAPVDAGYRGEIHAILYNTTNHDYKINAGEKIGQFVVRPVIYADFTYDLGDERGSGAFGSTGK